MKLLTKILAILALVLSPLIGNAHNLAPALLKLTLQENNHVQASWKVSNVQSSGLDLMPEFPQTCKTVSEKIALVGIAVLYQWQLACSESLTGKQILFTDLTSSRTTVMVVFKDISGKQNSQLISAETPIYTVPQSITSFETANEYLLSGIEHLIFGWDHVLFVLGLLILLFTTVRKLILAITCFTIGHSLSLIMASLGYLPFTPEIVEILIAITLIILALEIMSDSSKPSVFSLRKNPYPITFIFGLIHGCGFASVLADALSNEANLVIPLLSFNVGIEIGQLVIILASFIVLKMLMRMGLVLHPLYFFMGYLLGVLASYWLFVRIVEYTSA